MKRFVIGDFLKQKSWTKICLLLGNIGSLKSENINIKVGYIVLTHILSNVEKMLLDWEPLSIFFFYLIKLYLIG